MIIGYLVRGNFVCSQCLIKEPPEIRPVEVHEVNLGDYSQSCATCHRQLRAGKFATELFSNRGDSEEFRWSDMVPLLIKFSSAIGEGDDECAATAKRETYERVLTAIMADKLHDRGQVFKNLRQMMATHHRW